MPDLYKLFKEEKIFKDCESESLNQQIESKAKLMNRLREYSIKLFAETSNNTSLETHKLFSFLEHLKFGKDSLISCPQEKDSPKLEQTKEVELVNSILKGTYDQDCASDIIFRVYRKIVDADLKTLEKLFRIQALELKEHKANDTRHVSIFDVEFKFTYYDNSISIVVILTDYSEKQIISRLEMVNKEKETALVAVVNDMRFPLNAIKEYVKTIKESTKSNAPELKNELEVIEANCEHLSLLIHDILDNGFMMNSRL